MNVSLVDILQGQKELLRRFSFSWHNNSNLNLYHILIVGENKGVNILIFWELKFSLCGRRKM